MLCQSGYRRDRSCVADGWWDLLLELSTWRRRMGTGFVLDDGLVELVGPKRLERKCKTNSGTF